jgi:hypothetical protein
MCMATRMIILEQRQNAMHNAEAGQACLVMLHAGQPILYAAAAAAAVDPSLAGAAVVCHAQS